MHSLNIGPGNEVIVPAITFAATANAVVYQGGTPVFADIDAETLLLDPGQVEQLITPRTRAVVAVDYAGHPCQYDSLAQLCSHERIRLVGDACHAVGGRYQGRPVGSLAEVSTFSFHPVKNMTTGEGGIVTTNDAKLAHRMRVFRNHGITSDHHQRQENNVWFYEMAELGYNYRITDFQCALGLAQLRHLPGWVKRRQNIAQRYDMAFAGSEAVCPLKRRDEVEHAYHLYVVRLSSSQRTVNRDEVFRKMRRKGFAVNVHYIPVYLHPFYRQRFGTDFGLCPVAEKAYDAIISLPMHANLSDEEVDSVASTLLEFSG